jgi:hypothetical protein
VKLKRLLARNKARHGLSKAVLKIEPAEFTVRQYRQTMRCLLGDDLSNGLVLREV